MPVRTSGTIDHTLAVAALALAAASTACADEIYWVGYQNDCMLAYPTNASWFHGDNWFDFVVPGSTDNVLLGSGFDPGGGGVPRVIHFGDFCVDVFACPDPIFFPSRTARAERLTVYDGDFVFDFGPGATPAAACSRVPAESGRLDVLGPAPAVSIVIGGVLPGVGTAGDARLTVRNGPLTGPSTTIGGPRGGSGALTLMGASAELRTEVLAVGGAGDGLLSINDGGRLSLNNALTGEPGPRIVIGVADGGFGELDVSGSGSIAHLRGSLAVGRAGVGRTSVQAGGELLIEQVRGGSALAESPTGDGLLIVTGNGSRFTQAGVLLAGRQGSGVIEVTNGGSFAVTTPDPTLGVQPSLILGESASGLGVITASDADSRIMVQSRLIVGQSGRGEVRLENGASASVLAAPDEAALALLGEAAGSNGLMIVREAASASIEGQLTVAHGGLGNVEVSSGGRLGVTSVIVLANGAASSGSIRIAGDTTAVEAASQISVGRGGIGTLEVTDGALLVTARAGSPTGSSGILGTELAARGVATVDGATWEQDGALAVGFGGQGELDITGGGLVRSAKGYVARFGASIGRIEVSGAGSRWRIDGEAYVGGNEDRASSGSAQVHLAKGGQVEVGSACTLWPVATLQMEVAGPSAAVPLNAASVLLAGRIEVTLAAGYEPALGDRIQLIAAPIIAGAFGVAALPAAPTGITARLLENDRGVELAFLCTADLDGDGSLTIFDFLTFQNLFDAGDPQADFDGDGSLTLFDFLAFQNAFDAGCP